MRITFETQRGSAEGVMADLFISYSSSNLGFVKLLVDLLSEQGWSVFWDAELRAGEHYDLRLEKELEKAGCVLVIWTRESIRSDWVRSEAARGLKRKKLLPLRLHDIELPMPFSSVDCVDAAGKDEGCWLPELIKQLENRFRRSMSDHPPSLGPELTYQALKAMSSVEVHAALERAKLKAEGGYARHEALRELGQCHLFLGRHGEAARFLDQRLREGPPDPACSYLLALALLAGRRPSGLDLPAIREIEAIVDRALAAPSPPREAFQLCALIKYDYYLRNGMLAQPSLEELMTSAYRAEGIPGENGRLAELMRPFQSAGIEAIVRI